MQRYEKTPEQNHKHWITNESNWQIQWKQRTNAATAAKGETFQHLLSLSPWPCHHRLPSVTHLQPITSWTSSFAQPILGAHSRKVLRGCVKTKLTASDVRNHASIHFIGGPTAAIDEVTTTRLMPAWTLLRFCRQVVRWYKHVLAYSKDNLEIAYIHIRIPFSSLNQQLHHSLSIAFAAARITACKVAKANATPKKLLAFSRWSPFPLKACETIWNRQKINTLGDMSICQQKQVPKKNQETCLFINQSFLFNQHTTRPQCPLLQAQLAPFGHLLHPT